jgi:hypothetical protein
VRTKVLYLKKNAIYLGQHTNEHRRPHLYILGKKIIEALLEKSDANKNRITFSFWGAFSLGEQFFKSEQEEFDVSNTSQICPKAFYFGVEGFSSGIRTSVVKEV